MNNCRKIQVVILITGGRTGSDFFQSLLDGHTQILQFPGIFLFDDFMQEIEHLPKITTKEISNLFVNNYPQFFDSRVNKLERHNALGNNKNQFFIVDEKLFISNFSSICEFYPIDSYSLLYFLHAAYYHACGEDISSKRLLVLHLHDYRRLNAINDLTGSIIYTIRDPLANLQSGVMGRYNFSGETSLSPAWFNFYLSRIFFGLEEILTHGKTVYIMELERLHTNHNAVMIDFCNIFNLDYEPSLEVSSYFNLRWWGDVYSGKWLNGINPDFKNKIDLSNFFQWDLYFIEKLMSQQIEYFQYPKRANKTYPNFLCFLPFKFELIILVRAFKSFKLRAMASSLVGWYKRIRFMKTKMIRFDPNKFPYSLGSNVLLPKTAKNDTKK